MSDVVLFSGGEEYVDPWHPFLETSAVVADVLRERGFTVRTVTRVDALAQHLASSDLLVVNAGGGPQAHPRDAQLQTVIAGHRGGVLALHVAATLLPAGDFWEKRLGGRWVRGRTMHPARGSMRLTRAEGVERPGLPAVIDTVDEAYSWLRVSPEAGVLYRQGHDGEPHAVVWTYEREGARAAYSALGHDVEAYASPAVRALVAHLAGWASGGGGLRDHDERTARRTVVAPAE
ncbi:MAG: ThuA domain-containing protein [Microbacterium enclense]